MDARIKRSILGICISFLLILALILSTSAMTFATNATTNEERSEATLYVDSTDNYENQLHTLLADDDVETVNVIFTDLIDEPEITQIENSLEEGLNLNAIGPVYTRYIKNVRSVDNSTGTI